MKNIKYKCILIKISGEALMGKTNTIFDKAVLNHIADEISVIHKMGVKIGIVIGGGNIFRGTDGTKIGLKKINSDNMGILATIMNGIAFRDVLENTGIKVKLYSALKVSHIVEESIQSKVMEHLNNNEIIIFSGGTGNPFVTTDTAAAIKAIGINADLLIKATKVNGVYDKDPNKYKNAKLFESLSFKDAINKNLKIMDISAFDLCQNYNMKICVGNIFNKNFLLDLIKNKKVGTLIS